ncbi:DUF4929 domain-containing protein [Puteibacter caeruleilacunae]|nr:DUF4929 domain-containing protein [Puteibacter caeruleilacunae]
MKHLKCIIMLSIVLGAFASCSDNNDDYEGINEVFLLADGEKTLIESEEKIIDITVQLTRSMKEDISLTFEFVNKTSDIQNILELENNPVLVKAGENTAKLKVKSQLKEVLAQNTVFAIQLASSSNQDIILNTPLELTVKPDPKFTALTEDQVNLLNTYKNNGLDLNPWIGIIPVEVKITFPGGGYLGPFTEKYERVINGKTIITLSEHATANTPALVMTENAMGLEEYIYEILKQETILDTEFWTEQPMPQQTMQLINLSSSSEETFKLALDSLVFDKDKKSINFVRSDKAKDSYGDHIAAVGFDYQYSAWDRMKKLIDEGNQDAIDADEQGGSVNPDNYINITAIDEDGWYESNWIETSSSFNNETGEMKFVFNFDHANAGDYIKAEVTFTSPLK